ncbi:MAG: M15 family metallopeptidase [Minisyncoccia bacterium]
MKKNSTKILISLIILAVVGAIIVNFSLSTIKEQKLLAQKALQEELAQKEAGRKAKEEAEKVYLLGKFIPSQVVEFLPVPAKYNMSGYNTHLRKEALGAFIAMAEAASKEGVNLQIVSAARNFDSQKKIWDDKWNGITLVDGKKLNISIPDGLARFEKILEYSSVPGTSRHHWGTDIDVNMTVPYYFQTEDGKRVYEWLVKNASTYGFCQPYNEKSLVRPSGYNEEKWHWSYLPLAKNFTERYKTLITDIDLQGFAGEENVKNLNLINNYVLGINTECL